VAPPPRGRGGEGGAGAGRRCSSAAGGGEIRSARVFSRLANCRGKRQGQRTDGVAGVRVVPMSALRASCPSTQTMLSLAHHPVHQRRTIEERKGVTVVASVQSPWV
jgi:hypothetical protein